MLREHWGGYQCIERAAAAGLGQLVRGPGAEGGVGDGVGGRAGGWVGRIMTPLSWEAGERPPPREPITTDPSPFETTRSPLHHTYQPSVFNWFSTYLRSLTRKHHEVLKELSGPIYDIKVPYEVPHDRADCMSLQLETSNPRHVGTI